MINLIVNLVLENDAVLHGTESGNIHFSMVKTVVPYYNNTIPMVKTYFVPDSHRTDSFFSRPGFVRIEWSPLKIGGEGGR